MFDILNPLKSMGIVMGIEPMTMAMLAGAGAGGGILGNLFGKNKEGGEQVSLEQMMPDWQKSLGSETGGILQKALSSYNPGANMPGGIPNFSTTGAENTGLEMLKQILGNSDPGQLVNAAKGQYLDTLSGKYADPNQSPFIKAMTNISQRNLQDSIDTARANRGGRGTYFHSKGIEEETDLQSRTLDQLNAIVGQFVGDERGRMLSAANPAANLGKYINLDNPLTKIGASQSLGSLERNIDIGNFERQYQDFMRKQQEGSDSMNKSIGLYGTNSPYGLKDFTSPERFETNTFGRIMNAIQGGSGMFGQLAGMKSGGTNIGGGTTSYGVNAPSRVKF